MKVHKQSKVFSWTCDKCGKSLNHKKSINRHKSKHIESKTLFDCQKCSKSFDRKENLERHKKSCKDRKSDRQCSICLKSFKEPWQMRRHLKIHATKKTTTCKNCGNRINEEELESHSLICLAERPITLDEMNEEFPSMVPIPR